MTIGKGLLNNYLTDDEIGGIVEEGLQTLSLDGKRVLIIIPDTTRTMPMPLMFDLFDRYMIRRVKSLNYMVALGTHQPLKDNQLSKLLGRTVANGEVGKSRIFNHEWFNPGTFVPIGTILADEISQATDGLMSQDVLVQINKHIFDYDQLIICGPVFPHEVVGFSGGNKYLFPGIAGPEIINFTHWLGAIITNYKIIGSGYTPVRAIIDRAASFINIPVTCFALVVTHSGLSGLYFGEPQEAWQEAAKLSASKHIIYVDKPFQRVFSVMPEMYDDLWTAAKGMYKLEPVVADGGEIVIYAPHIREVSYTHGRLIDQIGYHCRDYFLSQWELFKDYPGGVLAHSTHVKGMGNYDRKTGVESARIQVTLATGIPVERCIRINLGYLDPDGIDIQSWQGCEDEGVLVVPQAGELLYRLRSQYLNLRP